MRGTAPLLGAVTGLTQQSCSRIPHLRVHILARKSRAAQHQVTGTVRANQQRCRSTLVSLDAPVPERSEPAQPSERDIPKPQQSLPKETETREPRTAKEPVQDGKTRFSFKKLFGNLTGNSTSDAQTGFQDAATPEIYNIIQEGHPSRTLFALLDPTIGRPFIRSSGNEDFDEAFCLLNPRYLIEPFREIFRYAKPSIYDKVRNLEERFDWFTSSINSIVEERQKAGHNLTLAIYRHLLDCARVMGDGPMATHVFNIMMPADKIEPDLDSYNFYGEAICWSNAYGRKEKFRLRVTPRILGIRGSNNPPPDLIGHTVARPTQTLARQEMGLRLRSLNRFKDLVKQGLEGNESTFTNLMVAMGRESRLADVRSVLKSVWNIDVDGLRQFDEEEIESPTFYEENSPLRPTSRLLFTVAHIYGSNNQIGQAISLVDYISRNYNLPIPFSVWQQLCEWCLILSLKRGANQKKQGQATGKVDAAVFVSLWGAMTDEPHNIVPDVLLHTIHARVKRDVRHLDEAVEQIRQARSVLDQKRDELQSLTDQMLAVVDETLKATQGDASLLPAAFWDIRHRYLLLSLSVERDKHLIIFALRRFFKTVSWSRKFRTTWERRLIPNLLEEFAEFLPNRMLFTQSTGVLELEMEQTRRLAQRAGRAWLDGEREAEGRWLAPALNGFRVALDTEDYALLLRNVQMLPVAARERGRWCFECGMGGHWTSACRPKVPEVSTGVGSRETEVDYDNDGSPAALLVDQNNRQQEKWLTDALFEEDREASAGGADAEYEKEGGDLVEDDRR